MEGNPPYPVHDEHPRYGGTEVLPPRSPRRTKRISMTDPDSGEFRGGWRVKGRGGSTEGGGEGRLCGR